MGLYLRGGWGGLPFFVYCGFMALCFPSVVVCHLSLVVDGCVGFDMYGSWCVCPLSVWYCRCLRLLGNSLTIGLVFPMGRQRQRPPTPLAFTSRLLRAGTH